MPTVFGGCENASESGPGAAPASAGVASEGGRGLTCERVGTRHFRLRSAALAWFPALLVVLAALRVAGELAVVASSPALPQWDPAKYGAAGLRLAAALRRLDPLTFLGGVSELSSWPPFFPLLEVPAFLFFGPGYGVPKLLVVGLFVLTAVALWWAGRGLDRRDGGWVGLLAAGFFLASPFSQLFGTLVMLEVPGTLLLAGALGFYLRSVEEGGTPDEVGGTSDGTPDEVGGTPPGSTPPGSFSWRGCCACTVALFFCKYNYGLLWLLPLAVAEARRVAGSWRGVVTAVGRRLAAVDFRRPGVIVLLVYLLLLAAIRLSGGVDAEVAGVRLRATSIGNPVYLLYLVLVARLLWRPRRSWQRWRDVRRRIGERGRTFARWVVAPIALWMLIPPHTKDFFGFVENRSSGIPFWSLDNLLFYPRALADGYAPVPAVGWATLLLALAAVPWLLRRGPRHRVLALALVVGTGAAFVHPYKLPRFFFTVAPLLQLAASVAVVAAVRLVARPSPEPVRRGAVAAVALLGFGALLIPGVDRGRLEAERALRTVPAAVRPVAERVAELFSAEERTAFVGSWNLFSPGLVEWQLRNHHRRWWDAGIPGAWRRPARVDTVGRLRRRLEKGGFRRVISLEPLDATAPDPIGLPGAGGGWWGGRSEGFRAETAWLEPFRDELAAGGRHTLETAEPFPAAGYRLVVYRRATPPPASDPAG